MSDMSYLFCLQRFTKEKAMFPVRDRGKLWLRTSSVVHVQYMSTFQSLVFYFKAERGSFMVWEINMGVCPRLEFDNIMFINCLGYDFYIYGAFEFLCNSIANL